MGAALCLVTSPLLCSMIRNVEKPLEVAMSKIGIEPDKHQRVLNEFYEIFGCTGEAVSGQSRFVAAGAKFVAHWQSILAASFFLGLLVSGRIAGKSAPILGVVTNDPVAAMAAAPAPIARDRLAEAWTVARRDVARLAVRRRALVVMIVYAMASGVLTALVPLSTDVWSLEGNLPHLAALALAASGAAVWGVGGARWRTLDVRRETPNGVGPVIASVRLEPAIGEIAVDLGWSPVLVGGVVSTCIGLPYQLTSVRSNVDFERNTVLIMLTVRCLLLPVIAAVAAAVRRSLQSRQTALLGGVAAM